MRDEAGNDTSDVRFIFIEPPKPEPEPVEEGPEV